MRPQGVVLLTVAVLLATIAFGIGAALEKATPVGTPSATASSQSSGAEAAGSAEAAGERAGTSETVLGINPESVPLIVAATVASLVLAGGTWLYWRRPAVLWLTAGAMAVFGGLDVVEIVHQLAVQHPTLVTVAAVVAILHGAAAVLAIRLVLTRLTLAPAAA